MTDRQRAREIAERACSGKWAESQIEYEIAAALAAVREEGRDRLREALWEIANCWYGDSCASCKRSMDIANAALTRDDEAAEVTR